MASQFAVEARNAAGDAIETAIGTGPTLRIRTGPPPANAAAARSGTILGETVLASDWLGNAANGVKTGANIPEFAALATGEAGHFEVMQDAKCWWQGDVTETGGGGAMELGTTDISTNQLIRVNSLTLSVGGA
jgi:hypothetical protein